MDNLETNAPDTANTAEAEEEKVAADLGKFKDVKALLDAYTSLVASGRGVPILTGGISVPSPKTKPATVKEAGRLAKQFLKNS